MSEVPLANWNGQEMPLDQVRVSVLDRAFLFGDAVYEALRVYRGRPWLCPEHMERLERSLREIRITCDVGRLERRMWQTLEHSGALDAVIYIQVTRGVAPRTHHFPKQPTEPNELIYVQKLTGSPHAAHRQTGVRALTQPDIRWGRRDIKSVNLLGNCLAQQAANEAGCFEAILVEPDGSISEGTHTSVFAVKDGCLLTAPNSHHILPGITRALVLKLARQTGIPITEHAFRAQDLPTIDELFLTGTTSEVLPIVAVDDRPIGQGTRGPVTAQLQKAYDVAVDEWLTTGVSA